MIALEILDAFLITKTSPSFNSCIPTRGNRWWFWFGFSLRCFINIGFESSGRCRVKWDLASLFFLQFWWCLSLTLLIHKIALFDGPAHMFSLDRLHLSKDSLLKIPNLFFFHNMSTKLLEVSSVSTRFSLMFQMALVMRSSSLSTPTQWMLIN